MNLYLQDKRMIVLRSAGCILGKVLLLTGKLTRQDNTFT